MSLRASAAATLLVFFSGCFNGEMKWDSVTSALSAALTGAPAFVSVSPVSPSTSGTPSVRGTVPADVTLVRLFSDSSCSSPLVTGSKADFEGPGLAFSIAAPDSTISVYGHAEASGGVLSSCVFLTTYVRDNTAPVVTLSSPAPGSFVTPSNQAFFTVSGTCTEESRPVLISSSASVSASTPCTSSGWSATLDLSGAGDGTISISADHSDLAANVANTATEMFTKDTTAPTVAITSPSGGSFVNTANASSWTLSGNCSETGRLVFLSGAVTDSVTCTSNSWSRTLDLSNLPQGSFTITADHSDAASNAAPSDSRSFTKDTVPPSVAVTSPASGSYINASNAGAFSIQGSCTETGRNVTITGDTSGTATCQGGIWSTDLDFSAAADGYRTIDVIHADEAGNSTLLAAYSLIKDTTAPTVSIDTPAALSYVTASNVSSFTVTGSCSEVGQDVVITGAASATTSCSASGWSATLNFGTPAQGNLSISASHVDQAGNPAALASRTFIHDTIPPAAPSTRSWVQSSPSSSSAVTAAWSAPEEALLEQKIKFFSDGSCSAALSEVSVAAGATTQPFTGTSGNLYSYRIYRRDMAGNLSTSNCSSPMLVGPLTLVFTTQPSTPIAAGDDIVVRVEVRTTANTPVTTAIPITLSLDSNPTSATLHGTVTMTSVSGVAHFNSGSAPFLTVAGSGYTLRATSTNVSPAASNPFSITPNLLSSVTFTTSSPTSMIASNCSAEFQVERHDTYGNLITTGASNIDFTGSTSGTTFYSDSSCGTPVSSVSISGPTGTFYAKYSTPGTISIQANIGTSSDTRLVTVNAGGDVTPPSPATSLALTPDPTYPLTLRATWNIPSATQGDLASQVVRFYKNSNCSQSPVLENTFSGSSTTTDFISGYNGQTYSFYVESRDAAGNSSVSSCVAHRIAALNIEVPIELTDSMVISELAGDKIFEVSRTPFDPDHYDGAVTAYFEVVASTATSQDRTVSLIDAGGQQVTSVLIPASSTTLKLYRSAAFTPSATEYRIRLNGHASRTELKVTAARIILHQTGATKTRIYIPLVTSDNYAAISEDKPILIPSGTSTSFQSGKHFAWNDSGTYYVTKWKGRGIVAATAKAQLSTISRTTNSTSAAYVGLRKMDGTMSGEGTPVLETTTYADTPSLQSSPTEINYSDFDPAASYLVEFKSDSASYATHLHKAGLWVTMTGVNALPVYYRLLRPYETYSLNTTFQDETSRVRVLAGLPDPTTYSTVSNYCGDSPGAGTRAFFIRTSSNSSSILAEEGSITFPFSGSVCGFTTDPSYNATAGADYLHSLTTPSSGNGKYVATQHFLINEYALKNHPSYPSQ